MESRARRYSVISHAQRHRQTHCRNRSIGYQRFRTWRQTTCYETFKSPSAWRTAFPMDYIQSGTFFRGFCGSSYSSGTFR